MPVRHALLRIRSFTAIRFQPIQQRIPYLFALSLPALVTGGSERVNGEQSITVTRNLIRRTASGE